MTSPKEFSIHNSTYVLRRAHATTHFSHARSKATPIETFEHLIKIELASMKKILH